MTLLLDDETVCRVFDWKPAVDALRAAYGVEPADERFPGRQIARGDHGWLRAMAGAPAGDAPMGLKIIAASPRNGRVSYLIPLFDQRSAELVALLDGHSITGFRTAATSALAADLMAPPGPLALAVIGSGFEARNHVRALAAVRSISRVRVYSPRAESRARFVESLDDLSLTVEPASSAEEAVDAATLVACAARSRDESPTLRGAWLRPGMTVLSIGSTVPEQREVDESTIARADLLVADMVTEVCGETGDLLAAHRAGIETRTKTVGLADLVSGRHPGRTGTDQILLYKSVGSATQDLAVAQMCVGAAERSGLGTRLPLEIKAVEK
ncbi:MAG: ornithine cyclodeaminase family protein [Nocardioides sp.]|uniref:ornithine cyclodeaminase family protein n=1 Tax=Nocardioides sp. TaxID=35761 RepID=UPI0039E3B387